jgi:uncharacterized surface protein with fasciclin (FAS1) repeats
MTAKPIHSNIILSLGVGSFLLLSTAASISHAGPARSTISNPAIPSSTPASALESQAAGEAAQRRPAPAPSGTVLEVAAGAGQFSTLVAAIDAAGLRETLSGSGPFTVFAPSDAAFAKLPAGTVENLLMPENKSKLAAILSYHVVPGRIASTALAGVSATPATVQGATLSVDTTTGVKIGGAMVTTADIAASNGVIHVIDTVLMPPPPVR